MQGICHIGTDGSDPFMVNTAVQCRTIPPFPEKKISRNCSEWQKKKALMTLEYLLTPKLHSQSLLTKLWSSTTAEYPRAEQIPFHPFPVSFVPPEGIWSLCQFSEILNLISCYSCFLFGAVQETVAQKVIES
jgi:hypothetical protein